MPTLYSDDTVATAVAIQNMNMSFVVLILAIAFLLITFRKFRLSAPLRVAVSRDEKPKERKAPRYLAALRAISRRLSSMAATQLQLLRSSKSDSIDDCDDSTPTAPVVENGQLWEQYDEPAYIRKGVQLSF